MAEVQSVERNAELEAALEQNRERIDLQRAEARKALYRDVEDLISTGFLAHSVKIGNTRLSLRSLSPGDVFVLQHRVGIGATGQSWERWAIAESVWMIDGVLLLQDPQNASHVHKTLRHLPKGVIDILFSIVKGLFNRVGYALRRTEAYCYEPYSRALWRLCGQDNPVREEFTGVSGTSRLGMNNTQRMWVAFNTAEDERVQQIQEWQAAKLVASAMSPKGIRKLNRSDENLRKQEEKRRQEIIEKTVRLILFGDASSQPDEIVIMVRGQPVRVPRVKTANSDAELADEMRRWVAGEKDWHDLVVDAYKNRIREQFAQEKRERETALTEAHAQSESPGVTGGTLIAGYTPEQIRELRPDLFGGKLGPRRVFDNSAPAAVYQKYVASESVPGRLRVDEGGVFIAPEEEKPSLQNQVQARRPKFSSSPIGPSKRGTD